MPRRTAAALLLIAPLTLTSCGVETALIGATLSAGASAAETGVSFHGNSALSTFELVRFEDILPAARDAADDLDLRLLNHRLTPDERAWFYYRYEPFEKLVVTIRKRTDTVTSVHLRVRSPSERAMASLFVRHLAGILERRDLYIRLPHAHPPPSRRQSPAP